MHKLALELFSYLKNLIYFLKICSVFLFMLLIVYWIQNVLSADWGFVSIFSSTLSSIVDTASMISNEKKEFLGAVLEYKYIYALVLCVLAYYILNFLQMVIEKAENTYSGVRDFCIKREEDLYNNSLNEQNLLEQIKIKKYQIYVAAQAKKGIDEINMEEETKAINKKIIAATSTIPVQYQDGFLYSFNDFSHIDSVIACLREILFTKRRFNLIICVQIFSNNNVTEQEQLDKLIKLKMENKIITMSDTQYRYSYNKNQKYNLSQLGVFQSDKGTFEVFEFVE